MMDLGHLEQCPACRHMGYYPFSDGLACILCEFRPERVRLSKNQRRKANKRSREQEVPHEVVP